MALTERQFYAIKVSERAMSVLSLLGSFFIIGTFLKWHYFRKPINRLVFYASFGNIMANVATLMSTSPIPKQGQSPSAVCQFQGVLIQWFMMADSLWVFCMALNVMLVFFWQYNSRQLRRLEKWYLLFGYGVPFLPPFAYIIVEKTTGQRIYGPATIWCWVDKRVEWLRIAFFYGPVWVVLAVTIMIYIYTGHHIFQRRKEGVRSLSGQGSTSSRPPPVANPFAITNVNRIQQTTEISVRYTTDSVESDYTAQDPKATNDSRSSFSSTRKLSVGVKGYGGPSTAPGKPTSADRQSSNYRAAVVADTKTPLTALRQVSSANYNPNHRRNAATDWNHAAWSYFRVAFLMFVALLIVWFPSSINRMHQFIYRNQPLFGLNLASALVLPLQGFWNAMVYISTTWTECKRAVQEIMDWIAAVRHHGSIQVSGHTRKESDHTLSPAETGEFGNGDVPLNVVLDSNNSRSNSRAQLHSADSITMPSRTRRNG